ncbi:MAG: DUF445 domain-containing protein [Pseudomonadota bacterium]
MTASSLPDTDADKQARLAATRRLAGGVLLALVAVYLGTSLVPDPPGWLRLIRHMAEAGMIGGLADWFAVEALFRHPLGLRIPHTALLPRNQKKAADSVGQFFNSYFLDPAAIVARVAELAPARRAAEWLCVPDNAALVAKPLTQAISVALRPGGKIELPKGIRREMRTAIESETATKSLINAISPVLEKGASGSYLTETLQQIRNALDGNRDRVLELVQDNSRWWVASRVDKGVSNVLVDGVINVIHDLEEPDSDMRKDFEKGLSGFVTSLADNGTLERAVHEGKAAFVASDRFSETLESIIELLRERMAQGLDRDPQQAEQAIADAIQNFASRLLSEPDTLARFERQMAKSAETAITELRDPIARYVTDVIAGWDADTLSERFEQEIGPDLQFIRINGAVLGALIGGVLFFVGQGLGALTQ